MVDKEVEAEHQTSGSLKYLLASATKEQLGHLKKAGRIRASWRLRLG